MEPRLGRSLATSLHPKLQSNLQLASRLPSVTSTSGVFRVPVTRNQRGDRLVEDGQHRVHGPEAISDYFSGEGRGGTWQPTIDISRRSDSPVRFLRPTRRPAGLELGNSLRETKRAANQEALVKRRRRELQETDPVGTHAASRCGGHGCRFPRACLGKRLMKKHERPATMRVLG